jgi:chorismate mutase / prephenate dehydratase
MADLDDYRSKIDELDKEITRLFEERMDTVINIANYKKDNNLPIFNRDREDEVIEKNVGYLKNKDYAEEKRKFFIALMEVSRELQSRKMVEAETKDEKKADSSEPMIKKEGKVGFFGAPGSFSEEAMIKYFGNIDNPNDYDEFEDVFLAVKNDEIKYGVLPIEPSSTGAISQVYDLLYKYGFYIVGEE